MQANGLGCRVPSTGLTPPETSATVLDGIIPRAAFSLSGEVVMGPNHLWLVTSFKVEAADVASSPYAQCLNRLDGGRSGFSGSSPKRDSIQQCVVYQLHNVCSQGR